MSEVRSDDCEGRELRTEEASRQKLEQRMVGLVAMLAVVLVGSGGHSRGGLIRKKEAIRGRMDEQPQENVMALVGQWRPTAGRPPRWPPPEEDWIWWNKEKNLVATESGRVTSVLREGEAVLEDGLRVWHPGDDDPNSAKVGGANLPLDGGGTSVTDQERN